MTIGQNDLRRAAARSNALNQRTKDYLQKKGFLSHSHKDRELALGLQQLLKEQGLDLYIDWQDATMPETPDGTTADRIRTKVRDSDVFIFLATRDSMISRWCPWELGFADGVKHANQIAVITTSDNSGNYYGNEYMQLYRRIDQVGAAGSLHWFQKGSHTAHSISLF